MLRRIALVGLAAAAVVPFTSTPASAICTIQVEPVVEPVGRLGPYNCNFCPLVERTVEKHTGDLVNCWT